MRKILLTILSVTFIFNIHNTVFAKKQIPELNSKSAVMLDLETDRILYKKRITATIEPGSFVKIMTAVIAIEHIKDANTLVSADSDVVASYDYSFGHMGILAGEKLTYDNLLHGMLLYDAGDAAEVLANNITESKKEFIKKMNSKAVEIGALNTNFTNPTGYPDKNQYSTVEDILKITKYAMTNEYFREIVGKSRYEMPPTNKYTSHRYLDNKNKFMNTSTTNKYYTSKAKGVKSSYIDDNNCGLVLQYENDTIKLMTIVANATVENEVSNAYEDTSKLIDYGINYYTSVKVISAGDIFEEIDLKNGKGIDRLLLEAQDDVFVNLPQNYSEKKLKKEVVIKPDISAPISKGDKLGEVKIIYNNEEYYTVDLTCPEDIKANHFKGIFKTIWGFISSPVLIVIMGLLLIVFVWSTLIFNRKKDYKINKK